MLSTGIVCVFGLFDFIFIRRECVEFDRPLVSIQSFSVLLLTRDRRLRIFSGVQVSNKVGNVANSAVNVPRL